MLSKTLKASVKKIKSAPDVIVSRLLLLLILALSITIGAHILNPHRGKSSTADSRLLPCAITVPNNLKTSKYSAATSTQPRDCVGLERASTNEQRVKGLSGRDYLAPNQGMLFIFDQLGNECFWMKDMKFSIDMIWLNGQKQITKIEPHVKPETYPSTFCAENTKYVIELADGQAAAANLAVGQQLYMVQ